jgi:DNA mismatch repair ATPase MutS
MYFNDHAGTIGTERLSAELCPALAASSIVPKYLALSACSTLIKYVKHAESIFFEPGSMRIRLKHNDKALFLDISTIEATELIQSAKETFPSQKIHCLLAIVDKARTRAGKQFLRRHFLEPPADLKTITMRQDLIEKLS